MIKHPILVILSCMFFAVFAYGQKLKIGTYTFKDGAIYSGDIENGKPNGACPRAGQQCVNQADDTGKNATEYRKRRSKICGANN